MRLEPVLAKRKPGLTDRLTRVPLGQASGRKTLGRSTQRVRFKLVQPCATENTAVHAWPNERSFNPCAVRPGFRQQDPRAKQGTSTVQTRGAVRDREHSGA